MAAINDREMHMAFRRQDRLEALRDRLIASFPSTAVHLVVMDVRDTAKAEALPLSLPQDFSEVEILINNAGLALGEISISIR